MKALTKILAGGIGLAALASAAPATAQYYPQPQPNYGYGQYGYGNQNPVGQIIGQILGYGRYPYGNYGYNQYSNQGAAIDQCARAVDARLNGYQGYYGYGNVPYQGQYGYGYNNRYNGGMDAPMVCDCSPGLSCQSPQFLD